MNAILGGAIIGLAVSLMLYLNGRVTGISGIIGSTLSLNFRQNTWRYSFILGLFFGGIILFFIYPEAFIQKATMTNLDYIIAGLLVGFGTLLGNGCTSGHGVCGLSRFSLRSLVATITFITFGVLSVLFYKKIRGEI